MLKVGFLPKHRGISIIDPGLVEIQPGFPGRSLRTHTHTHTRPGSNTSKQSMARAIKIKPKVISINMAVSDDAHNPPCRSVLVTQEAGRG